jgi:hypothetical protein
LNMRMTISDAARAVPTETRFGFMRICHGSARCSNWQNFDAIFLSYR